DDRKRPDADSGPGQEGRRGPTDVNRASLLICGITGQGLDEPGPSQEAADDRADHDGGDNESDEELTAHAHRLRALLDGPVPASAPAHASNLSKLARSAMGRRPTSGLPPESRPRHPLEPPVMTHVTIGASAPARPGAKCLQKRQYSDRPRFPSRDTVRGAE